MAIGRVKPENTISPRGKENAVSCIWASHDTDKGIVYIPPLQNKFCRG